MKSGLRDPAMVPGADKDLGLLLRQARDKVAFLPFGLLIAENLCRQIGSNNDTIAEKGL